MNTSSFIWFTSQLMFPMDLAVPSKEVRMGYDDYGYFVPGYMLYFSCAVLSVFFLLDYDDYSGCNEIQTYIICVDHFLGAA